MPPARLAASASAVDKAGNTALSGPVSIGDAPAGARMAAELASALFDAAFDKGFMPNAAPPAVPDAAAANLANPPI